MFSYYSKRGSTRARLAVLGSAPVAALILVLAAGGLAGGDAAVVGHARHAVARRRLPGCETFVRITQHPANPHFQSSGNFTVEYGDVIPPGNCLSYGTERDLSTFHFWVNGTDYGSWFTFGSPGVLQGTNIPLVNEATNTWIAALDGWNTLGAARTDRDTVTGFVDTTPMPDVGLGMNNLENQRAEVCAVACFAGVYSYSTVPYVSLGAPRGVSLVYNSDRARPLPVVFADVVRPTGAPAAQGYTLKVRLNGSTVTFTNSDTLLRFTASDTARLAGQFDARPYTSGTGMYPVQIIAGATYAGGKGERTIDTLLMVVNEERSPIARGWTVAGVQRLYEHTSQSFLITEGDGSAVHFDFFGAPAGDFSRVTRTGTGSSKRYVRAYRDSSKAYFGSTGLMDSIVDRFGTAVRMQYDAYGRLTRVYDPFRRDPSSNRSYTALAYDDRFGAGTGGLASITEPGANGTANAGRVTYVRVNADSTLRAIVDPDGDSTRFTYGSAWRLATVTDRAGNAIQYGYDALSSKLTSITLPTVRAQVAGVFTNTNPVVQLRPWQTVHVPTATTATTAAQSFRADSTIGRVTDPEGSVTSMTVDAWGQPLTVTDPAGGVTTFTRAGLLTTFVSYPTGAWESFGYDGDYFLTSSQALGRAPTYYHWNYGLSLVDSVKGPSQPTQRYRYSSQGRLDSVTVGSSYTTRFYYTFDQRWRLDSTKDVGGHFTRYHYEATFGNVDSTLSDGNRFSRWTFDGFGRTLTSQAQTEPRARVLYDTLGRVRKSWHEGLTDTTTVFFGKLFADSVKDAKGQKYRVRRNALGWVTAELDPTAARDSILYGYDRSGRVTSWTNRRGNTLAMQYDGLGRVTSKRGTGAVADSFSYAANRRSLWASNQYGRYDIYLAATGWTDSVVTRIGGQRFRTRYVPDTLFRLASSSTVDSSGRITFASKSLGWDAATGVLNGMTANGATVTFGRDGELLRTTTTWPSGLVRVEQRNAAHTSHKDSFSVAAVDTMLHRTYEYDLLGRLTQQGRRSGSTYATQSYAYDPGRGGLSQVTYRSGATCGAPGTVTGISCSGSSSGSYRLYGYDDVGNLTQNDFFTADYGAANRIDSLHFGSYSTTFDHDLDGNVTRKGGRRFYWSADGLLDSVTTGGVRLEYKYDALGRVVRRDRNGSAERYFLWDGDHLLAELNATATNRIAEYVYLPGTDRPLSIVTGATTIASQRYFVQDRLGNVVGVLRASSGSASAVDQELLHYPLGGLIAANGALADTNRARWKGMLWEGDSTQLYYARSRWYDPEIGRFLSEDPTGLAGGMNKYAFAGNDFVNGRDPYGLFYECKSVAGPKPPPQTKDPGPRVVYRDRPTDASEFTSAGRVHGPNASDDLGGEPATTATGGSDSTTTCWEDNQDFSFSLGIPSLGGTTRVLTGAWSQDGSVWCPGGSRCGEIATAIDKLTLSPCAALAAQAAARYKSGIGYKYTEVPNDTVFGRTRWTTLGPVVFLYPAAMNEPLQLRWTIAHEELHISFVSLLSAVGFPGSASSITEHSPELHAYIERRSGECANSVQ